MKTIAGLTAVLLLAGCAPSNTAPPSYVKHTLGDRYYVEVENTQGGSSLTFNSKGSGTKVDDEHYELTWGSDKSLKIDNGQLQVDSIKYGKVEPKDRIVIQADGKVLINGSERVAPP